MKLRQEHCRQAHETCGNVCKFLFFWNYDESNMPLKYYKDWTTSSVHTPHFKNKIFLYCLHFINLVAPIRREENSPINICVAKPVRIARRTLPCDTNSQPAMQRS